MMRAAVVVLAVWIMLTSAVRGAEVRPLQPETFRNILAEYAGRPLIVHFWGLTCSICMQEMPEWGQFARKQVDLPLVLINWDPRPPHQARVSAKLKSYGLEHLASYALGHAYEEKLRFLIDRNWMGELPYTLLVAPDGTITPMSGAARFADLAGWLEAQRK